MTRRSWFLDWLEDKLQSGIGYCQGRTVFLIPKIKAEEDTEDEQRTS